MAIFAFLNGIFLRLVGFALSAVMFLAIPAAPSGTAIEAKDPAGVKLQASVIADNHMQSFDMQNFSQFTLALRDIARAQQQQDVLVMLGDNTMNGQTTEYIMLYGLLRQYNRTKNTFVAMGNHDLNIGQWGAATGINRHNFFLQSYNGVANDKAYYSREFNGFTFVTIAGEGPGSELEISDAQLAWLAETMAASPAGKPIFVFIHQDVDYFPRGPELRAILEAFPNVFVFNGHWHAPLGMDKTNGVSYINVPSLHAHNASQPVGEGLQIEVYEDRVELRGRDYMNGKWIATEFTVPLV